MRHTALVLLAAVLVFRGAASGKDDAALPVTDVPARTALVAPPRVAVGPDERVYVALSHADGIDVVTGTPDAKGTVAFGKPVRAVVRDDLIAGGRRGVRIAVRRDAVVVAAITRRTNAGGGDLLAWRSPDGGASWSEPARVGDVEGCAAEGLFDLAALADGRFAAVWLDVRKKGTRLLADFSDDGARWAEDAIAYTSPDGSICECCHPAVAPCADGGTAVAWRNSVGGARDIWVARAPKGSSDFGKGEKCGTGTWRLSACPMAGPALVVKGTEVVTAWRRDRDVFLAAAGAKEKELGPGNEPQVAVSAAGLHTLWVTREGLVHLAPGASAPSPVAANAEFPCAAGAVGGRGPAFVVWLDSASRRARIAALR
jgi:hypothetical protein